MKVLKVLEGLIRHLTFDIYRISFQNNIHIKNSWRGSMINRFVKREEHNLIEKLQNFKNGCYKTSLHHQLHHHHYIIIASSSLHHQ